MVKLLISLYLVVISSILVINQVSDYIWQSWFAHTPDELRYAKQVAKSLQSSLPGTLSDSDEMRIIDIDSVAWLPEQHTQLLSREVIVTFDEDGAAFLNFMLAECKVCRFLHSGIQGSCGTPKVHRP